MTKNAIPQTCKSLTSPGACARRFLTLLTGHRTPRFLTLLTGHRTPRFLTLLACLAGGAAALPAGASAILVRLPSGKMLSYQAISRAGAPSASARTSHSGATGGSSGQSGPGGSRLDGFFSNLDYSGGPVMPSNTNYTIVWAPSNYGGTGFQSGYVTGVNQFFSDLAAASGSSDNSDAISTQYRDASGQNAAYNSHNGGTLVDTDPMPSNGCPAFIGDICLTDAQLQSELNSFLSAHSLPRDLTHEYFLLTPPSLASCFDSSGQSCSANVDGAGTPAFCAYHGYSTTAQRFLYANIPDLSGVNGCDPFITNCPAGACQYNSSYADGVLSAVSHEHNESLTDPDPNNAWTDWQSGCFQGGPTTCGGEIGDKCNNDGMSDPNLNPQWNGSYDTPYNEVINGHPYLLQREWSNQTAQCLSRFTPNGTSASASFTASPQGGTTINFSASASSATGGVSQYVWQFNDRNSAGQPPQNFDVETSSPTISHDFPAGGVYVVALTVMAQDGTSGATAREVLAGARSLGASFTAPSGRAGRLLSFAGRASDVNPSASITGYSWSWGDGSSGAGASASHKYSRPGNYTVTLTVTDNWGASGSVSHRVVASGPRVSFRAGHGHAHAPISFRGSVSDPGVGIASVRWNFGDGHRGSGLDTQHTYGSAGLYRVTVTVIDRAGARATSSRMVRVGRAHS